MPYSSIFHKTRQLLLNMVPAHQISLVIQLVTWLGVFSSWLDWHQGMAIFAGNLMGLLILVICPRCRLLGPNFTRLPEQKHMQTAVALTFDDGPDPEITPAVLDILEHYGAQASFFCIGSKASQYPALIDEILSRGHRVENHSHHHSGIFATYSTSGLAAEIQTAQNALTRRGFPPPQYFRAPMGFRSPLLSNVLKRLDMTHIAWTRRGFDHVLHDPHRILKHLVSGLAAGDILLLHDNARPGKAGTVVLDVLPLLLEHLANRGLHAIALPPDMDMTTPSPRLNAETPH